jgi:uncharacterized protein YecE (DUF72 family)
MAITRKETWVSAICIQLYMRRIGTAGWSVPMGTMGEGTHLRRYSRVLSCCEINSTFYRAHRSTTWAKWARDTPTDFRFSIKAPKTITHEQKLCNTEHLLKFFLEQIEPLGEKAGPILFQLPPSLTFDPALAEEFLAMLRSLYKMDAALEPRHATWFTPSANALLKKQAIVRVAADPPEAAPQAAVPGGCASFVYYRLHGSPRTYYSSYTDDSLIALAAKIKNRKRAWVIFDNTALAYAYDNAVRLQKWSARGLVPPPRHK